ncbi:FAD:protein FMN transferase [Lacticaseibacillus kribbianus]|uniref:FAD:protein FMN transferase n=1 Tax=Lacticaseibacillus kribbianus TaxID=2926292 RepID=UPI001CD6D471|nr:FAD:protein FMN transferase [Lacticaseibacillus kribbianus]
MPIATRTLHLMGTVITLWVQAEEADTLLDQAEATLIEDEHRFSANADDSDLAAVNRAAGVQPVAVAPDLFALIRIGREQSLVPHSALDIAIGPLVQTWRIGFANARHPDAAEIAAKLPLVDPAAIELDEAARTVFLPVPGMKLDLGALAKGFFADQITAMWQTAGATAGFIDLGGNVKTFGQAPDHEDGAWRVGIQNPFLPRGNQALTLRIQDRSLVTSGIYERSLTWHGRRFHHVLDRHTGYPIATDLASITIVSAQSLDGELWTTHLFATPAAAIIARLNQVPDLDAVVITQAGDMAMTDGLKGLVV